MAPGRVASKVRMIALLNRGNRPIGLEQYLHAARLDFRLILQGDYENVQGAFVAAKAGSQELFRWPADPDQILPAIQRAWRSLDHHDPSAGNSTESIDSLNRLSRREREIIQGFVCGKANRQLAIDDKIGTRTVEFHRSLDEENFAFAPLPNLSASFYLPRKSDRRLPSQYGDNPEKPRQPLGNAFPQAATPL